MEWGGVYWGKILTNKKFKLMIFILINWMTKKEYLYLNKKLNIWVTGRLCLVSNKLKTASVNTRNIIYKEHLMCSMPIKCIL